MASLADEPNGAAAAVSIQEAELAVQRAIAVREAYKATLQTLVETVASNDPSRSKRAREPTGGARSTSKHHSPSTSDSSLHSSKHATSGSSNAVVSAASSTSTPRSLGMTKRPIRVPPGKEMHVLGDWLLLMRAASVNVVEAIQTWRRVGHQCTPQPYVLDLERGNYLLAMCDDLDFLDGAPDLVEWLGFRLARNPFVAQSALDDVMSDRLNGRAVHRARSLKYWASSSWQQRRKARARTESDSSESVRVLATATNSTRLWRTHAVPPPALVKPLASILPNDDAVDGERIEAVQQILLEEEALYGRQRALRAIRQYLVDASVLSGGDESVRTGRDAEEQQHRRAATTVHDEIARQAAESKYVAIGVVADWVGIPQQAH